VLPQVHTRTHVCALTYSHSNVCICYMLCPYICYIMYICIHKTYVCMYAYILCRYVHIHPVYICMHISCTVYTLMYIYGDVCIICCVHKSCEKYMHVYTQNCVFNFRTHLHVYIVPFQICMYVYILCIYYIHIYKCVHIYFYGYTQYDTTCICIFPECILVYIYICTLVHLYIIVIVWVYTG